MENRKISRNTVLVAILKTKQDFALLQQEGWYRIPVKSAPANIKQGIVKYIAFYHPSAFQQEKFSIRWYAPIEQISIVPRSDLFPGEITNHPKKERDYYKIEIRELIGLQRPIYSQRHRRITFIPTSEEKFFTTLELVKPEINFLFNASPLEDILFQKFMDTQLFPEREYFFESAGSKYFLDFALFCKCLFPLK